MHIALYEDSRCQAWDDFVYRQPQGTMFHTIAWKRVVERTFGHPAFYFYAQEGDAIRGVLPLFWVKSPLSGNALVSVPFSIYGGILADSEESAAALLQAAKELAQEKGVAHVEFRHQHSNALDLPVKDLYVTFVLPLPSDPEVVWKEMRKRNRNILRKGEKSGLGLYRQPQPGVLEPHEVDTFYHLFARSQQALGTPVLPRALFTHLQEEFGQGNTIYSVTCEGKIITSLWVFSWRDFISPYYIGYDPAYLQYAPNNWVLWQVIKDACAAGYRYYDMGRSRKDTGSYHFKIHWGIEPQPLHYQYYLHRATSIPQVNPSNPKYDLPRRIWSRLPLGLTKAIGPHLVKYLG